jgi:hypothetical protein
MGLRRIAAALSALLLLTNVAQATDRKFHGETSFVEPGDDGDAPPDSPPDPVPSDPPPDPAPSEPPPSDPTPSDMPSDSPPDPGSDPTTDPSVDPSSDPSSSPPPDTTPDDSESGSGGSGTINDTPPDEPTVIYYFNDCCCDSGFVDGGGDGGSAPGIPPTRVNIVSALLKFALKASSSRNSQFSIKIGLAQQGNAPLTNSAVYLASLRTITLTIGSADFTGTFGTKGRFSYSAGDSSYKGQLNPTRFLQLNAKGLNLAELLGLDLSSPGNKTATENIALTVTDLSGQVTTLFNQTVQFNYVVANNGAKGFATVP